MNSVVINRKAREEGAKETQRMSDLSLRNLCVLCVLRGLLFNSKIYNHLVLI